MKKRMMKEWMTGARERILRQGETGQTYTGRMRRSAKRVALVAAALLSCAGMSAGRVSAEGSRDIVRTSIENAKAINPSMSEENLKKNIARWSFMALGGSFMGVSQQQKIKFYAYEGEEVFFASEAIQDEDDVVLTLPDGMQVKLDLTATKKTTADIDENKASGGYIASVDQEAAGPKGIFLPAEGEDPKQVGSDGFDAYQYTIPQSGVYEVQFKADNEQAAPSGTSNANASKSTIEDIKDFKNYVTAWDITVTQPKKNGDDTEYYAVNGRVWMDAIAIQTQNPVYGDLYAVTRDGYIWKFSLNGMNPYTFSMYANARGNIGAATNASAYHSVHLPLANNTSFEDYKTIEDKNGNLDGVYILGPDNAVTDIDAPYHMFVNKPDTGIPDSIVLSAPQPMGKITSFEYDGSHVQDSEENKTDKQSGYVGVGGYFDIGSSGASSYRIVIDMSNMYAKHYHGDGESSNECNADSKHNEEICLSTDTDDSFIYYNKEDRNWYSLRTQVKNEDGSWNRHPESTVEGASEDPEDEFKKLVQAVQIAAPEEFEALGKDFGDYKCLGTVLLGNAAVDSAQDRVYWNGRDEYGRILPVGSYFGKTGCGEVYAQAKAGEVHFPLGDVESMPNGVAIWLENAPGWMMENNGSAIDTPEQIKLRSKLYYNNLDKSLLRDYVTEKMRYPSKKADGTYDWYNGSSGTGKGNNAWYWNLPSNKTLSASGENAGNIGKLKRTWVAEGATFENQGIDGVASYTSSSDSSGKALTKEACRITNDGIDHGVADVWTHVLSKEIVKLDTVYLYNLAEQKMLTGFVYLDTPKDSEQGTYDKMTDDRELPKAKVVVEYGSVEETTYTDTDGNYAFLIDMDEFKDSEKKEVTVTVTYDDEYLLIAEGGTNVTTYKVTTANEKSNQHIVDAANKSVQTVNMGKEEKAITAERVGYVNNPTKSPLRIEKKWTPKTLKDNSMSASFVIKGVYEKDLTSGTMIENDSVFGLTYNDTTEKVIYRSVEISVDEALGGVTTIETLPQTTYKIKDTATTKPKILTTDIEEGEEISYRVFENMSGSSVVPTVVHDANYKPDPANSLTYDNWTFTNKIVPSKFAETVWYDANNNGQIDEGEKKIEGVKLYFAKLDETSPMESDDPDDPKRYKDEFEYAPKYNPDTDYGEEGEGVELVPLRAETPTETDSDGQVIMNGLLAGRYRVTIELPETELYNTATYTNNGEKALVVEEGQENTGKEVKASSQKTTVVQYIEIGVGSEYQARVGYGFMGGLSIRKNVEVESVSEEDILNQIEEEPFTFEIQLAEEPVGTKITEENQVEQARKIADELGIEAEKLGTEGVPTFTPDGETQTLLDEKLPVDSILVEVETFNLDLDNPGSEVPADKDMHLVFTKLADIANRWSAVFHLMSGQRITVPNVDANTEYWLWEYDNTNGDELDNKNGSSTEKGADTPLTYMPKGYSLAKLVGSQKMRHGNVPSTSRTVLVNYTNIYNPLPVQAFGGDGTKVKEPEKFDKEKNAEGKEIDIDRALNIKADVKIEDTREDIKSEEKRYFQEGDRFKIVLETVGGVGTDGRTALEKVPSFTDPAVIAKLATGETNKESVLAEFTDDTFATFTEAGTYTYLLREARPFYDDGVDAIPGISYAPEQYRLTITVQHTYQQLRIKDETAPKITAVKWEKLEKGTEGAKDTWKDITEEVNKYLETSTGSNPIVFTNTFNPYNLDIEIAGKKTLVSSVDGVTLDNLDKFSFTLQPAGVKADRSVESVGDTEGVKGGFNISSDTLKNQPMPQGAEKKNGIPVATAKNGEAAADGDNVSFGAITFTEENAGVDRVHASVYKYIVKEVLPEGSAGEKLETKDGVTYDTSEQAVYVRVYKEIKDDENGNQMQTVVAEMCDANGSPASFGEDFVFTNKYDAQTTVSLGEEGLKLALTKIIQTTDTKAANRGFKEDDHFQFVLEPQDSAADGAPAVEKGTLDYKFPKEGTASSDPTEKSASVSIPFENDSTITFTNIGEYTYTLRELDPRISGIEGYDPIIGFSYDPTVYIITIKVINRNIPGSEETTEHYNGELSAEIIKVQQGDTEIYPKTGTGPATSSLSENIVFTNEFSPYSESVTIKGTKELYCEDPDVKLDNFVGGDGTGLFQFRLTPEGSAELEGGVPKEALTFDDDKDQPMPEKAVAEGGSGKSAQTVNNKGANVVFGEITFDLEDIDNADGGTTNDPIIYRYKVEELLEDSDGGDGIINAVTGAMTGEKKPIPGTSVELGKNDDRDNATAANVRYVYFKVYNQRQDDQDHVVVTRCDRTGADLVAETDFTITNTYKATPLTVELGSLIGVQKTLQNESSDQKLPESANFMIAVEAVGDAPMPESVPVNASVTVDRPTGSEKSATALFDLSSISLTFDKAGKYEYILRELDPFMGDTDADIVPGVMYDTIRYKLTIVVKNNVAAETGSQLLIDDTDVTDVTDGARIKIEYSTDNGVIWNDINGLAASDDHALLAAGAADSGDVPKVQFVNVYRGSSASLPISGYKVLDGTKNLQANTYNFKMKAVGVATLPVNSEGKLDFESTDLENVPLPEREKAPGETSEPTSGTAVNGENTVSEEVSLARGVVDFGTLTFTDEQAGETALNAKVYHYQITEDTSKCTDTDGKMVKDHVVYDTSKKDLYIRVYKLTVVSPLSEDQTIQAVVAEFCDEYGRTNNAVSDFTFTNVYTAPPLSVSVNELLGKELQKNLTEEAGTFEAASGDEFGFAFYPTSYPQFDAPMPHDADSNMIPRVIQTIGAEALTTRSDKTISAKFKIADDDVKIAFSNAGTFTYRIRELNPDTDTDVDPKINAVDDVTYDTNEYTLKVVVSYNNEKGQYEITETELTDSTSKVIAKRQLVGGTLKPQEIEGGGKEPDVLAFNNTYTKHCTLTYDDNNQNMEDVVYNLPVPETREVGSEEKLSNEIPAYFSRDAKQVVFVGWAEESVRESITGILDRDDKEKLKGSDGKPNYYNYNSKYTMPEDNVTLYAIWGYDENGNGIPDVLEDLYILKYETNAQKDGKVEVDSALQDTTDPSKLRSETDLLMGETVTLAGCWPEKQDDGTTKQKLKHSDATPDGAEESVPVVFAGWTKKKTNQIFGKEEKDELNEAGVIVECTIEALPEGEDDSAHTRTVYAAWGWDTNKNGTADVLEDFYTLTYDGNAERNPVDNLPEDKTPYVTGNTVTLKGLTESEKPTRSDLVPFGGKDVKVAFIGWTRQQIEDIFSKDDTLPRTVEQVTFIASNITVYAAWGYDTNGNDVADILERYQLFYVENPQNGGFVGNMPSPNPITNLIPGNMVTLANGSMPADSEDLGNRIPRHSMVAPSDESVKMDVAFIGWTKEKTTQIYGRDEDADTRSKLEKNLMKTYTIPDEPKPADSHNCVVYAAWGWDENGNGTADVFEQKYTLKYDLNAQTTETDAVGGDAIDKEWLTPVQGLLDGETVTLADCSPTQNPADGTWTRKLTHTQVDGVDVLFLGWTEKQNGIFDKSANAEDVRKALISEYTIRAKEEPENYTRTVYAAWGYDTNKNGVADVLEDKYALHYDGNSDGVIEDTLPKDESKYVTGDQPMLKGLEDPYKPQHNKGTFDDKPASVLFLGWTAEKHAKILDKTDTMPDTIKNVTFADADITVYALWGYDTNGNNTADVLEGHTLTYDPNAQDGLVRNMPTPNPIPNLIDGDEVELAVEPADAPIHDAVTEDGKSVPVAFIGWSETEIVEILGINDKSSLESTPGTPNYYSSDSTVSKGSTFTMRDTNVTLYAIWGYDRDGNGTADVLEATYTLHYDLNALGGTVEPENSDLIKDVTDLLEGERVTLADCRPKIVGGKIEYVLTYTPGSGESDVSVVFVGWTEEENKEIYDFDDVVELITNRVTMRGNKTVYAAWGYDRDKNGVADVLETTYNLIYEENPQEGGNVTLEPDDKTLAGNLTNAVVKLSIDKPQHSEVSKDGVSTPVAFIGWTLERTTELYTKDSPAAPVTVMEVTFQHDDIHVYAAWGYDENKNGVADVLERQFTITYHGNAQESGTVSDVPERETGILPYNAIELKGKLAGTEESSSPELKDLPDKADAIFLGWTETQSGRIYDVTDEEPLTLGGKRLEEQLFLPGGEVQFVNNAAEADAAKEADLDLCAVWTKDVDLYAVWAKDANTDGIADYLQGLLVYDGNPVEGMAWNVPESEIHSLTEKNAAGEEVPLTVKLPEKATAANGSAVLKMADGTEIPLPIHSDVEGKKIVFAGWTDAEHHAEANGAGTRIYSRTDSEELKDGALVTTVPMKKSVTVYAVWGYDENNNGTADVLEELYTLKYEENAQSVTVDGETETGTVTGNPAQVEDLLTGETVTLVDGETVMGPDDETPIPLPTHTALDYVDADGNVQTDVPVLFVGWTESAHGILEGADEIPADILHEGTIGEAPFVPVGNTVTVYAAWGYNTNDNNVPDVLEDCRLTYDANAITGTVEKLPDPLEHLISGQPVTLVDGETVKDADDNVISLPTHSPEEYKDPADGSATPNVPVLFVGWTENPTDHIYRAGEDMPPCATKVEIAQKETTVYAAWGFDLDGNGTVDVKESCTLVYDGNPRRTDVADAVTGLPKTVTDLAYAKTVELDGLNGDTPEHKPVMVGGVQTAVAFIGWTREPVEELLTRSSAAPACVTSVQMLHSTVTVYAAWGLDTNNNGTADVVEERYSLVYDGDAQAAGDTVSGLPLTLTGLLEKDEITLQAYPDPASAPQYTDASGKKVLFIGWTAQPNEKIYGLEDVSETVAALLVNQVTVGDKNLSVTEIGEQKTITVYAAWSYDKNGDGENGDGIPDVWQNCSLIYDGNAPDDSIQKGTLPVDGTPYDLGATAEIMKTPTPKRTDTVEHNGVQTALAFVGWTREQDETIYGLEDTRETLDGLDVRLLETVTIDKKKVTVYAVWGYDTNGNGTADILEERYGLTYDLLPLTGSASGAPEDGNLYLTGTNVTLVQEPEPLHSAVEENGELADVIFLGWTADPSTKYYRKTDENALPVFLEEAEIKTGGTTVYAAWGLDTNHNGTADVLEENYTLIYDDNEVKGTVNASFLPASEAPFISGDTAELRPMSDVENARAHSKVTLDGADRDVVFLGWTAEATTEIYTKESASMPDLITEVTFTDSDITVYAAWGFDANGNGTADILERHTLWYRENPQNHGFVGDMPEAVPNKVSGDKVALTGHPRHSSVTENGVRRDVVFAGWTLEQTGKIYSRTDAKPDIVTEVTFEADEDVEVFAAWGYDTNGNGTADVLEENYTLTYDGNPIDGTEVKKLPAKVEGLLVGEQVYLAKEIPTHDPVQYKDLTNVSVLFIGWTETENTKIYARGEQDYVAFLKEYVVMPNGNKTLYAAWGYDLDGDNVADVLEDHFDLKYNGNARSGGGVSGLPSDSSVAGYLSGAVVELDDTAVPTHTQVNGTALVFLGWTAEPDETIYAKESGTFPDLITEVTFADSDVTVYAAWGYDTNGNGKADILESYTLNYDANIQKDGFADQLPSAAEDLIYKQEVELPRGPRHSAVKPDGSDQNVDVAFVGWTETPEGLLAKDGVLPEYFETGESYEMKDRDSTLYALWGVDANGNGTADVLETKYTLTYDGHSIDDTDVTSLPKAVGGLIYGERVELADGSTKDADGNVIPAPKHEDALHAQSGQTVPVLFVGWSAAPAAKIYERGDKLTLLESPYTITGNVTVYAVWGYDTDENGTADVLEGTYRLSYKDNAQENGFAGFMPESVAGFVEGDQWTLSTDPIPRHSTLRRSGVREDVAFVGWTREKDPKLLERADAVPALVENVTFEHEDITVYAVWGIDENGNGTADALDPKYTLTYDGNPADGSAVDGYPLTADGLLAGEQVSLVDGETVTGADGNVIPLPEHVDAAPEGMSEKVPVLFLGWTGNKNDIIYAKGDGNLIVLLGDKVTIPEGGRTVYAAWGYDTDGNGTADVLENRYDLIYDGNAQKNGEVKNVPVSNHVAGDLSGATVELDLGTVPKHTDVNGTDVVFIGWTLERTKEIYTKDSPAAPVTVERVTFGSDDITVYAAWGYDENGNGIADVLETKYTLTYHGNAHEDGVVSGMPGSASVSGILCGTELSLSDAKPRLALPTGEDVIFLGWTRAQSGKIYDVSDEEPLMLGDEALAGQLLAPGEVVTVESDIHLYAAWAKDANHDGIADYLQGLLVYDGNPVEGLSGRVPAEQIHPLEKEVKLADGKSVTLPGSGTVIPLPTHSDVAGRKVAFLGWTAAPTDEIYGRGEESLLPERISGVTMTKKVTVYAAWGYDDNQNGIPDVLEELYTLTYVGNAQQGGTVDGTPEALKGLLAGERVTLADGRTVTDAAGNVIALPTHSAMDYTDAVTGVVTEDVPVLFLGWTTSMNTEIYEEGHNPPACVDEVVIDRRELTVYAAWAFDRNLNNIPDVIERCRLVYDGNRIVGETSDVPESRTDLEYNETVSLSGAEPGHTDVNGTPVLFLGWTDTPTNVIYAKGAQAPDCIAQVRMNRAVVTVYAAWGFDENGNGIPDVREDYRLLYDANAQAGGTVTNMPLNVTGLLSGEGGALSRRIPQHTKLVLDGKETEVVFIGWTAERTQVVYSRRDTAPACVDSFVIDGANVTVYAAWGYDTDGSGKADVLEGKYSLTYDGNPIAGDVTDVPSDDGWYLVGEEITLATGGISHSEVDSREVIFLGWSLTKTDTIYEPQAVRTDGPQTVADVQAIPALVERVTMEEGGLTVYAVWSYAEPLEEIKVPFSLAGMKTVSQSADLTDPFTMQGGEFSFAVKPASANPASDPVNETVVSNAADGSIPLIENAVYRETGTYQYTIEELVDSEIPGMRYDDSVYELTVTVSGRGREAQADLTITRNRRTVESILFENTYVFESVSANLEGRKTLTGRALESGEFTFVLEPVSAEVEEEAEVQNPVSTVAAEIAAEPETESESVSETEAEPESESESAGETQPETPEQSEVSEQSETPVQSEVPEQSETPVQSEVPEQSETPVQSETPEQSEAPEQSETQEQSETPEQTVRVLACSYVPHTHTDECFDESGVLVCGYADYVVHTHNEDCYDTYGNLVCVLPELEEHKHDASCYEWKDELVCGLLEGSGHTHSDSCYAVDTTLICGLEETPGHTHSDSCYTVDTTLICGLEESADHYHDEYCYDMDGNLICGWEESAGHYHTDSCYRRDYRLVCGQEETPAHYHTDSCYEKNVYLTCGMAEAPAHIHDASCYLSVQQCDKPEIELHRHGKKCYERVYDEEKDEWQKVLVCDKLEVLEHVHGPECFKTVELSPAAVQAEDIILDGQAAAELSEDEPVSVQDGSTAVIADGLQILSVEVVPMETSSQPMPQTATEALTEAMPESETAAEALTEAVSESETATETAVEGQAGLQTLALDEPILPENELTVTRALALDEIPMPTSPETQNTAAGVFRFAGLEYTKPGVYRYRISEKNTEEEGIVFDGTVYYATVTVTKNDSGALQSAVELRTESGNTVPEITFENKYLPPVPEISVSQSVNDGPILEETQNVYEGDVITYYLTVTNSAPAGSASAKEVTVVDSIPSGLELMAGSISDGGTLENRVITWKLGDIPAGESRTVSFRVTAPQVQTNIVRTNMGNVRAANNPYGANVWSGSNVVRINVLASRPKTSDTPGAEEPQQTEPGNQEPGSESEPESESESESEDETTEKTETETDETETVVPSASDDRSSGGSLGGSSSGGSNESTAPSAVQTGDETNVVCWLTLMLLAGAVLILLQARSRNRCDVSEEK